MHGTGFARIKAKRTPITDSLEGFLSDLLSCESLPGNVRVRYCDVNVYPLILGITVYVPPKRFANE